MIKSGLLLISLTLVLSSLAQVKHSITPENIQSMSVLQQVTFEDATFRDLAFHPDSEKLIVAVRQREAVTSLNGQVIFLDTQNLGQLSLTDNEIVANTLTFSPDGTLFAVGSEQGEVRIFNTQTLEPYITLQPSIDIVNDLAISPNNDYLGATFAIPTIVHEGDSAFQLITLPEGKEIISYPLEVDIYGGGIAFDDSGQFVFFSTDDFATNNGKVYIGEIATGEAVTTNDYNTSNSRQLIYDTEHEALYYIGADGIYVTFPLSDDRSHDFLIETNQGDIASPTTLTLHPTQPILVVGYFKSVQHSDGRHSTTNAGMIEIYNANTGEKLTEIDVPEGAISHLAFSPDGTLLASGGMDGTVRLWGIPRNS